MPLPEKSDNLLLKVFMHLRAAFLCLLAHERSVQKKKTVFFEAKTEYNKVLKINVKIPASGKNSSAVFFISNIKRYCLVLK